MTCLMTPDDQTCTFIVSLKASLCPFLVGVSHVLSFSALIFFFFFTLDFFIIYFYVFNLALKLQFIKY